MTDLVPHADAAARNAGSLPALVADELGRHRVHCSASPVPTLAVPTTVAGPDVGHQLLLTHIQAHARPVDHRARTTPPARQSANNARASRRERTEPLSVQRIEAPAKPRAIRSRSWTPATRLNARQAGSQVPPTDNAQTQSWVQLSVRWPMCQRLLPRS
jgi:hypothetical protein